MFKNTKGQEKGITLIALVITVIVLLILAGISISMLSGDNSILNKAGQARDITGQRDIEERIQIAYLGVMTENNGNVEKSKLQTALEKEFGSESVKNLADDLSTVEIDGKQYSINGKTSDVGNQDDDKDKNNLSDTDLANINKWNSDNSSDKIAEITGDAITNDNLKNNDKIKAVLTGEVPLTTEMTYVTGTKDTGVVVSIDDSEFVWVPVPVAIASSAPSTAGIDLAANPSTERPIAILQSGSDTNYQGVLYQFNGTTSTYQSGYNVSDINTPHREPAELEYYDIEDPSYDVIDSDHGIILSSLQTEYNYMVASVAKYGGFYVGRYELGLEGTNPVSKPASDTATTADAGNSNTSSWYGLYSKCKSFSATNLTSTMMWGSQYDAMMNWMAKTGKAVGTADTDKYNQEQTTGSKNEDIINNVKDLYGCHIEWTLEALSTEFRACRGGTYLLGYSPSSRGNNYRPISPYDHIGSRLSLYIK